MANIESEILTRPTKAKKEGRPKLSLPFVRETVKQTASLMWQKETDPFQVFKVEHEPCLDLKIEILKGQDITKGSALKDLLDTPDPYVILRVPGSSNSSKRTKHVDNCIHPIWNETFHFYLDPSIQDFNLEIYLMDANYTTDEELGKNVLPINTLILDEPKNLQFQFKGNSFVFVNLMLTKNKAPDLRFSLALCNEETEFLRIRRQKVWENLKRLLGEDQPMDVFEVPTIGILGSGGGFRAMTCFSGAMKALYDTQLLQCATYIAGLSGSSWYISTLYSHDEFPNVTHDVIYKLLKESVTTNWMWNLNKAHKYWAEMMKKYSLGQPISFTDFFGHLLGDVLLKGAKHKKLTDQQKILKSGEVPFPLYTCLHAKRNVSCRKFSEWIEFSPYEIGIAKYGTFMKSQHLGCKFIVGKLIKEFPELPLHFLQGVWGSAFTILIKRLLNNDKRDNVQILRGDEVQIRDDDICVGEESDSNDDEDVIGKDDHQSDEDSQFFDSLCYFSDTDSVQNNIGDTINDLREISLGDKKISDSYELNLNHKNSDIYDSKQNLKNSDTCDPKIHINNSDNHKSKLNHNNSDSFDSKLNLKTSDSHEFKLNFMNSKAVSKKCKVLQNSQSEEDLKPKIKKKSMSNIFNFNVTNKSSDSTTRKTSTVSDPGISTENMASKHQKQPLTRKHAIREPRPNLNETSSNSSKTHVWVKRRQTLRKTRRNKKKSFFDSLTDIMKDSAIFNTRQGRAGEILNPFRGLSLQKAFLFSPGSTEFEDDDDVDSSDPEGFHPGCRYEPLDSQAKKLFIVDSGLAFNSPFPLLLRPQRAVDIYLSFDFSQRVHDDERDVKELFRELLLAEKWANQNKASFPPIESLVEQFRGDGEIRELYVFKDPKDAHCPVILHFPLINNKFKWFSSPDKRRETKEELDFADFSIFEDENQIYNSTNFTYSELQFDRLVKLMEFNTLQSVETIKNELIEIIKLKRELKTIEQDKPRQAFLNAFEKVRQMGSFRSKGLRLAIHDEKERQYLLQNQPDSAKFTSSGSAGYLTATDELSSGFKFN